MPVKPQPNHRLYIETLRRMTPAQRLQKAFELTAFSRELFLHGLRKRHPDLTEEEIRRLATKHLIRCHSLRY
jgi:hypothetical protein